MKSLISQIKSLQASEINKVVETRLSQFESFAKKPGFSWFSELCFCILAANSKQKTAQAIQEKLGKKLLTLPQSELTQFIRDNKHRFHNNKAKYIVQSRAHSNIKHTLTQQLRDFAIIQKREFLVNEIKGIGMKEASHFLRNTGTKNLAILDRHIISVMYQHGLIDYIPKSLTTKTYLNFENKFLKLAKKLNMSPAKLDLFMWYLKTGEVLK